jgi:hypothetical protein
MSDSYLRRSPPRQLGDIRELFDDFLWIGTPDARFDAGLALGLALALRWPCAGPCC